MAIFLTRSIRTALRLHVPQARHVLAAIGLGICMHPSYMLLSNGIQQLYQIGEETQLVLQHFQSLVTAQPLWAILLLMALLPAICEELAFRGFIFGGLLHDRGVLRAIVISALFFGFTHTVLQQSISASFMGLVLGYIAWRTGGVVCTMVVHAINNTLSLSFAWSGANGVEVPSAMGWAITNQEGGLAYESTWLTCSMVLSIGLLLIISRRSAPPRQLPKTDLIRIGE
jgi:sodium transport system permease protein